LALDAVYGLFYGPLRSNSD